MPKGKAFAMSEERTLQLGSKRASTQEFPDGIPIAIGHFHAFPSMKNEERHYYHLDQKSYNARLRNYF